MKHFILGIIGITMTGVAVQAQSKPKTAVKPKTTVNQKTPATTNSLKNSSDSFSYALGMNIAHNLSSQGITTVGYAAMQKAMNDVFQKKTLTLNDQQANTCIQQELQKFSVQKAAMEKQKADVEKQKSKAFLDANAKRKEVITLPSGLQYEVLRKADSVSASPKLEDTVVAHYAGTLIDGKEFDNSYKRGEPLTIPVGGVIKGWTEALQLMHVGEKWKVYIPSDLGYGDRGAGADIPGGAALIFEMELLGIKQAAQAAAAPAINTPDGVK